MTAATYATLAALVDLAHAALMVLWALGLPLLFWHARPRLARAYLWCGLLFTVASFVSHEVLGECFLTTLARDLRLLAGASGYAGAFTIRLVELVAGVRPDERWAVVVWQGAIVVTTVGALLRLRGFVGYRVMGPRRVGAARQA